MSRIKELLSRLSPAKRRQAQAKLSGRLIGEVRPVAPPNGPLVSDNQRRLWALHRAGAGAAYTISCAYRIEGTLSVSALRRAFRELLLRHESLRTGFMERAGELVGLVHPVTDRLAVIDAGALPDERRAAFVTATIESQSRRVFRFDGEPMFQVILHVIDSRTHVLHIAIHHILCDQWSLEVMRRDLLELYAAFLSGSPPAPAHHRPPVPEPHTWSADDKVFWSQSLTGAAHYPNLPFDRLPTTENNWRGERRHSAYGELGERIAQFAAQNNCTSFHVLLAAFAVAYARWTDSRDVCIGTRVAGRVQEDTADAVGFFVNMLPIRLRVPSDTTVSQWLEHCCNATVEVLEREQTPFEALLNLIGCARDAFLTPLIPLTLTYQNIPVLDGERISDLTITELEHHNHTAKGEIDLAFEGQGATLELVIEYRSSLFDWDTLVRLIDEHKSILSWMLVNPEGRLHALEEMLASAECGRSFLRGERVAMEQVSLSQRLVSPFTASAEQLAVAEGDRKLTFAELDRLSASIATALLARADVSSERLVAIHLTPGADWIVAALGCLRAGVPYLGLDPAHPQAFRDSVCQAAKCALVIASSECTQSVSGMPSLSFEALCSAPDADQPRALPDIDCASLRTAFYLYTSGSTGTPKIVPVSHKALFNCIDSMIRAYPFATGDVIGIRTPLTFAPAVKQWLGALIAGRPLIVLLADIEKGAASLAARIRAAAITRLYLVPSQVRDLAHEIRHESQRLDCMRVLTVGGEPLSAELWNDVRATFPKTRLLNNYGSSEVSDITFNEVHVAMDAVAVGTSIDNVSVYILGENLEPVGAASVGQIFVSGASLSSGYFDQPDSTAAAYLPDPFAEQPGARMFRTGDYGRIDSSGRLIYLGRRDQQLKVNGCRVDAGHVTSVLLSYSQVKKALTLTRPGRQDDNLLVAYVSPRLTPADTTALRRYLLTRLPHYMQPGAIVSIDEFPLLANGKVDRLALPAPSWDVATSDCVAPRSDVEKELAAIWMEVLEVPVVGIDDNFFDLGGHSILAIRVLARIKESFGIELSQAAFFQSPTLAELVARMESIQPEAARAEGGIGTYREGIL
jgi:amino acid adenylation domain-containing protein